MTLVSVPAVAPKYEPVSADHMHVLGDDSKGDSEPHSTAIAIGKKCVLACAHSLALIEDSSKRSTKTKKFFMYEENYWIQPAAANTATGKYSDVGVFQSSCINFILTMIGPCL